MIWHFFPWVAGCVMLLWILGQGLAWSRPHSPGMQRFAEGLIWLGTGGMTAWLVVLWIVLERPPLRTLGETRLWYAVLLPWLGLGLARYWNIGWLRPYSLGMACMFLGISLAHPDAYDQTLMPALQSIWFVPHVTVYIIGYVMLAACALVAVHAGLQPRETQRDGATLRILDQLVSVGLGLITVGMLIGAVWAKEAWGHYWSWDPKETWAFLSWGCYVAYLHLRRRHPAVVKPFYMYLTVSFLVLLICWFGLKYLPTAQMSVHIYSR